MGLKEKTAGTIKWNLADKLASQLLYALTGIVLANKLSQEDFGLVGAILVVQAFALMFVDSGFASALLQRKMPPNQREYSTVFWFNMAVAVVLYVILWFAAPLISIWFHAPALVKMSRIMFISIPLNALGIVQINRMVKQMDVRPVVVSNVVALSAGSVAGIVMALTVANAWAIVVQTLVNTAGRSAILWVWTRWCPTLCFSRSTIRSFFRVGAGVMFQSFLNNVFLNIYGFFIGNRVGMVPLGLYSQADKWSKMLYTSISGTLTSSFLPTLSEVQDDDTRLKRTTAKMNRFTSYILFFAMGWMIVEAAPLFHFLFGSKWDASIVLFQLLIIRGIFTVFTALYSNYVLAMGKSRLLVISEFVRDVVALGALIATFPVMSLSTPERPVYGLELMLYGQIAAAAAMFVFSLVIAAKAVHGSIRSFFIDSLCYIFPTLPALAVTWWICTALGHYPFAALAVGGIVAVAIYAAVNRLLNSKIQQEMLQQLLKRKHLDTNGDRLGDHR